MTITVLTPYRRFGIGRKLLHECIKDVASDPKIKNVTLHVQTCNQSALEFYKSEGFDVAEELPDYYTHITPADATVLRKKLHD